MPTKMLKCDFTMSQIWDAHAQFIVRLIIVQVRVRHTRVPARMQAGTLLRKHDRSSARAHTQALSMGICAQAHAHVTVLKNARMRALLSCVRACAGALAPERAAVWEAEYINRQGQLS